MKRLRAEEVDALLEEGCAMCRVQAPIAENLHASCVLDRFAARRGHLLVVMKRHAERIAELSWDEWQDIQRLAWEAAIAVERVIAPSRTWVAALGSARATSRSFPHVHVHVVPIDEADRPAEVFTWRHGVLVYEGDEAREIADALRAAWPR